VIKGKRLKRLTQYLVSLDARRPDNEVNSRDTRDALVFHGKKAMKDARIRVGDRSSWDLDPMGTRDPGVEKGKPALVHVISQTFPPYLFFKAFVGKSTANCFPCHLTNLSMHPEQMSTECCSSIARWLKSAL
jgi:hypothetical protein